MYYLNELPTFVDTVDSSEEPFELKNIQEPLESCFSLLIFFLKKYFFRILSNHLEISLIITSEFKENS